MPYREQRPGKEGNRNVILDKLGGIAKNIEGQDGEMLAVNKLNSKIHAEQQAAAEELRKIGEYYYNLFLSGGQTAPEIAEFCQSAKSHYDEAAQAQAEIGRIRVEAEAGQGCADCCTNSGRA